MRYRFLFDFKFTDRGYFTSWTNWSECVGKCGIGNRERNRRCRIKSPRYARIFCKGPKQTKQPCVLRKCGMKLF